MLEDPWRDPPEADLPAPLRWLLDHHWSGQVALAAAYALVLAAFGVLAGFGVAAALLVSALMVGLFAGAVAGMLEARRRAWHEPGREAIWSAAAMVLGGLGWALAGLLALVPAVGLLVLLVWGLFSLPLLLFRR